MKCEPCIRKLRHVMTLSSAEEAWLTALDVRTQNVEKGADLVLEGQENGIVYLMLSGWAVRHRHLADGRRQIVNIVLPGDWIGLTSVVFSESDHGVTTVTEAVVSALEHKDMFQLFQDHPRLGVGIFWTAAQEDAVIAEHLVDVGRRTAYERVGHMFLELFLRLQVIDATEGHSFDLPLNQVALADALGLSQVHVNRTLQRLRREGLLDVSGRRATILDQTALESAVEFERTYLHLAGLAAWLRRRFDGRDPPPRRPDRPGLGLSISD